jgi:hypothetical protein
VIINHIISFNSQNFFTPVACIDIGMETQHGLQGNAFEQVGAQLVVSFVFGPSAFTVVDNGINSTTHANLFF